MYHLIIVGLLLLVLAWERVNYALSQKIADKSGVDSSSFCSLLFGKCPMASICAPKQPAPVVAVATQPASAATTSGFSSEPSFLDHAREMDARKMPKSASSPIKKAENMMMKTDQTARKLRSTLVRGG